MKLKHTEKQLKTLRHCHLQFQCRILLNCFHWSGYERCRNLIRKDENTGNGLAGFLKHVEKMN